MLRRLAMSCVIAVILVFLAGFYSWAFYSEGPGHYIALALSSPFILSSRLASEPMSTYLAYSIYLLFSFLLITLLQKAIDALRHTSTGGASQ